MMSSAPSEISRSVSISGNISQRQICTADSVERRPSSMRRTAFSSFSAPSQSFAARAESSAAAVFSYRQALSPQSYFFSCAVAERAPVKRLTAGSTSLRSISSSVSASMRTSLA